MTETVDRELIQEALDKKPEAVRTVAHALLTGARSRILHKENWCSMASARNSSKELCSPRDSDAVQFCAHGALAAETYRLADDELPRLPDFALSVFEPFEQASAMLRMQARRLGFNTVASANDKGGHFIAKRLYVMALNSMSAGHWS